eukprot:EG_transcript_18762
MEPVFSALPSSERDQAPGRCLQVVSPDRTETTGLCHRLEIPHSSASKRRTPASLTIHSIHSVCCISACEVSSERGWIGEWFYYLAHELWQRISHLSFFGVDLRIFAHRPKTTLSGAARGESESNLTK